MELITSLIFPIVSVFASLFAISKGISQKESLKGILSIALSLLPIVFMQQVVLGIYQWQIRLNIIILIITSILLIILFSYLKFYKKENVWQEINTNRFWMYLMAILFLFLIGNILSLVFFQESAEFVFLKTGITEDQFITQLETYKINREMFSFLRENYLATTLYFFRFTQILLMTIIYLLLFIVWNYRNYQTGLKISEINILFVILSAISAFLTVPTVFQIIYKIISLF